MARVRSTADAEEVSVDSGAAVTRRAAVVWLGGALAGGMMASACGVVRAGTGASGVNSTTALNAATGQRLWSAPAYVVNPNNGSGPWLTFADNAVYAVIGLPGSHAVYRDDVVLALDGRTGARKWMTRTQCGRSRRGPAGSCGATRSRACPGSSRQAATSC